MGFTRTFVLMILAIVILLNVVFAIVTHGAGFGGTTPTPTPIP